MMEATDKATAAIEEGLFAHVQASYAALTALGHSPAEAQQRLEQRFTEAMEEWAGTVPPIQPQKRPSNKPMNASYGNNDRTSNRV